MQSIKADGESSLCDMAVLMYGNIEGMLALVKANDLSFDDVPEVDAEIMAPTVTLVKNLLRINDRVIPKYPFVETAGDQALMDLAIQETGSFESVMQMAFINGISITDELELEREYRKTDVVDERIVAVFAGALKPASNVPVDEEQLPAEPEGIDYWIIENTFIVS